MTTMIEKLARAIAIGIGDDPDREDIRLTAYDDAARACLAALLEPTEKMVEAGLYHGKRNMPLRDQWQAMIRAALEEKP